MVDVLILGNFRKGGRNFLIFLAYLATLDGIVMYHKVPSQQQHLLLAEEPHAEQIGLGNRISLHEFELLEVDIEKHQLRGKLNQEGNLAPIVQKPVIADVQRLYNERQIGYFRLDETRSRGLLIQLELVADQRVRPRHQYRRVEHRKYDDVERPLTYTELRSQDARDLL